MDGWNTTFLLGPGNFSGAMLNFRGVHLQKRKKKMIRTLEQTHLLVL